MISRTPRPSPADWQRPAGGGHVLRDIHVERDYLEALRGGPTAKDRVGIGRPARDQTLMEPRAR